MIRLRIFNSLSLCIYPSSIIDISKTAKVTITEGRLIINASGLILEVEDIQVK